MIGPHTFVRANCRCIEGHCSICHLSKSKCEKTYGTTQLDCEVVPVDVSQGCHSAYAETQKEVKAEDDAARHSRFRIELDRLINQNCMENGSGTPDFILARYLDACLAAFDDAVNRREKWYGREQDQFGVPVKESNG